LYESVERGEDSSEGEMRDERVRPATNLLSHTTTCTVLRFPAETTAFFFLYSTQKSSEPMKLFHRRYSSRSVGLSTHCPLTVHSPQPSTSVTNEWICNCTPQHFFMALTGTTLPVPGGRGRYQTDRLQLNTKA
jgi:hypothetical protein